MKEFNLSDYKKCIAGDGDYYEGDVKEFIRLLKLRLGHLSIEDMISVKEEIDKLAGKELI